MIVGTLTEEICCQNPMDLPLGGGGGGGGSHLRGEKGDNKNPLGVKF